MPRKTIAGALTAVAAVLAVSALWSTNATAETSDAALAQRWAPVHYQDTDDSDADADYLSPFDYDGDWEGLNNWDNQDADISRLTGAAYYSVVATPTHWFITYAYFHPRDWHETGIGTHENDMEGATLAVRQDGSQYGAFEGMVTVAHNDFYSYVPPDSPYEDGDENIDGTIRMQEVDGQMRPTTWQEAKGHGLYAWDGEEFPGGDGVVYYPGEQGEVPESGDDREVSYALTDIFAAEGLWERRDNPETYAEFGTFIGDDGAENAANAPWGWDDQDDGDELQRGMLALDPALLFDKYFSGTGDFARDYTSNRYQDEA